VVTETGDSALIVGETGQVVAPRNPAALADAIISSLAAERAENGRRARRRILDNFSVERMTAQTAAAITAIQSRETV
jgi:glycosyltransferase involved in cell wall biosynthesis